MAENALETYKQLVQDQGQALLDVIQSVALGDLDVETPVPEGVEVLSDLAIGIEMMIDDIRETLAEQERARAETEQARQQTEAALQEMLALQRRYLGQEWQDLVATADQADQGYLYSEDQEGPTGEAWLPAMTTAVQRAAVVAEGDAEGGMTLALPIHLHDQVIGALGFSRPEGEPWNPDEISAVEEIAEQVGWALENQRLFDDAQLASLLMSQRVNELDCLNAIGRKIDESPLIAEFLEWVAQRIPSALRYPDICRVAIEFEGQVYGATQASELPRHIVAGLHIGGERVGQVVVAYTEDHDFINEESALLGDIIRRVSGYIEKQRLIEQTQTALSLLGERVNELNCLNDIGRKIDETPSTAEFLEWVAQRIPSALRYPNICQVAIEFEGQVYGATQASELPRHIVAGLHIGSERVGQVIIAYTEEHVFINEESALLGDIVRRVSGYIENRRLFDQAQARAQEQATLSEMGRALSARLDVEAVLENIYRYASRLVDTTNFYIALHDDQRAEISFPLYTQGGKIVQVKGRPFGKGLTEHVIQTCEPLLIREDVFAQLEEMGIEAIGQEAFSWLGVPMAVADQVIGVISIQSHTTPNLYDEHDRDLLTAIASQAAIAITNANLFAQTQAVLSETEDQAQRLAVLNQMSTQLNSAANLDEILRIAAAQINHVIPADRVSLISLLDDGESYQVLALRGEKGASPAGSRSPLRGSTVERTLQENRIINVSQTERDDLGGIRSFMMAPLHKGGQASGTLNVGSKQAHAYGPRDEDLMRQIALILSATMENRQLFEQTQEQLADLTTIQRTISELTAARTFEEAVGMLLSQIASAVQADAVSMFMVEEEMIRRVGRYPTDGSTPIEQALPLADYPLTHRVIKTREPLALMADDPRLQEHARQAFEAAGVTANATIPLVGREGVIGTLAISLHQPGRAFSEHDVQILQTLADQATIAIERVRLLDKTARRAHHERILREITARVRGSTNPDIIVRTAVRELGTALSRPTFVRLGGAEQLVRDATMISTTKGTGSLEERDESHA